MDTLAHTSAGVPTGPHLDNRRIAAALIDLAVPLAMGLLAYAAGLSLSPGVLLVVVGWALYYFFALESGDGQTLGKRAMKLRVVSADGTPATMEQIAKRTVVRIVDGHIVGLIVMLATGERRVRLGDIVAGTVVTDADESEGAATDAPAAERVRRGPSLKLPSISKPSLRMPSRGARSKQGGLDLAAPEAAPMPAALDPDPVPQVQPFEPFAEPGEPEPFEEFPAHEEFPPPYFRHDEPEPEYEPEPEPADDHDEHGLQAEPELQTEPEFELDPEPEPGPVKPIETVSAIDLVMEDAEERHPGAG